MSNHEILLLVLICGGAFIVPLITRSIQMPNAAGEILYGLLLGSLFSLDMPHSIQFLGELGFILLMYLAGLEIDFDRIVQTSGREISIFLFMYCIIVLLSCLAAYALDWPGVFALVFLTTAVGLLFPVLKDCNLLHSAAGQRLLLIGTLGEIISLLAFTGFILHTRYGLSMSSLIHVAEIGLFGVAVFISLKIYRHVTWWFPQIARTMMTAQNSFESSVRGNLVHMFVFVAVAGLLNLEWIIGAFLGGMIFAALFSTREELLHKMGSFGYGFLIPLFFITVGIKFDLHDFLNAQVAIGAGWVTLVILFIRILASPVLLMAGFSTREMVAGGLALTFPLTLLVAIATFGLDSGVISKTQSASILLAAIFTSILYPLLFKKLVSAV